MNWRPHLPYFSHISGDAYNANIELLEKEQQKRKELLNQQMSDEIIKNDETEKDDILREEKVEKKKLFPSNNYINIHYKLLVFLHKSNIYFQ